MTDQPNFLVVRYANGSAGKFLLTVLMASKSVAHFDSAIETNKSDNLCVDYVHQHFSPDIANWLKTEPKHSDAWNLHHVSSNYPRGDDLSQQEFFNAAKLNATEHFWNSVQNDKLIPFIWHKQSVPVFFGQSKFVTIVIDPQSVKWFHRARWYKQYAALNGGVHIKELDPSYNSAKLTQYYQQFSAKYLIDQKPVSFIKTNIIKDPKKILFQNIDNFIDQPPAQFFLNLSDILSPSRCVDKINELCKTFGIVPISESLIIDCHRHWLSCHNFKYTPRHE